MTVNRSDAVRSLEQKGFRLDKSGDHLYFHHEFEGKVTGLYTKISHSRKRKEIANGLLLSMRKQLGLDTIKDARDLLNCPMGGNMYNSIMKRKGIF